MNESGEISVGVMSDIVPLTKSFALPSINVRRPPSPKVSTIEKSHKHPQPEFVTLIKYVKVSPARKQSLVDMLVSDTTTMQDKRTGNST